MSSQEPSLEDSLREDLPWLRNSSRSLSGERPRLNRRNLFLLVLREAYADGYLEDQEKSILGRFAKALGLEAEECKKLSQIAKREFQQGKITGESAFDLKLAFHKACLFAAQDGDIDPQERGLLASLGRGLGIESEELDKILERALERVSPKPTAEDPSPLGSKSPADESAQATSSPPPTGATPAPSSESADGYRIEVDADLDRVFRKFGL